MIALLIIMLGGLLGQLLVSQWYWRAIRRSQGDDEQGGGA